MKLKRKILALTLAAIMMLGMCVPALAAPSNADFTDVPAGAWYAEAVTYCHEQGWMNGTSAVKFSPEEAMTRAMLAAVLYHKAGSPAVSGEDSFIDTESGSWYSNAVLWSSRQGLITGYGNGLFGTDDPVSREQLVTILWHQAGDPASQTDTGFADNSQIADWAREAVAWAKENNVITGKSSNRFDPQASANRAEVAAILINASRTVNTNTIPAAVLPPASGGSSSGSSSSGSSSGGSSSGGSSGNLPAPTPSEGRARVLVAYFSGTGTTRGVAQNIAAALEKDAAALHEIIPQQPYTTEDLNYNNPNCRSVTEQHDPNARPAIANSVGNMEQYDVVFLGYPIWNNDAPRIIYTFLESEELKGKTVVPFCTSGGSSITNSISNIQSLVADATWLSGQRFSGAASQSTVKNWLDGLNLELLAE